MHFIVVFLSNGNLFQWLSLRITFFRVSRRNNIRKIIPSFPNSKTAKIIVCCISASITAALQQTHTT
jgi:hypothetical protein